MKFYNNYHLLFVVLFTFVLVISKVNAVQKTLVLNIDDLKSRVQSNCYQSGAFDNTQIFSVSSLNNISILSNLFYFQIVGWAYTTKDQLQGGTGVSNTARKGT